MSITVQASKPISQTHVVIYFQGKRKAVQLDTALWEELIADLKDLEEIDRVREANEEHLTWERAKEELHMNEALR